MYSNGENTDGAGGVSTGTFDIDFDSNGSVAYDFGSVTVELRKSLNSGLNAAAIDKFTVESVESISTDDDLADGEDWYASTYAV